MFGRHALPTGILVVLLSSLASCGGLQPVGPATKGETMDVSAKLPSITDGVVRHELENGMTLLVRQVADAPATALVTWVKTGYFHEPDAVAGISHVVEHMFFNGTPTRPGPEDISRETQSYGGVLNAGTAYDHTSYYAVMPSDHWREGMAIQADALQNPLFDAAVLQKEMGAIKQEARRKLDNPMAFGREKMFELAFDRHRIRRWRIGTEETLDSIDRDELVRWFEDQYRPSNIILSVVGDADPDSVLAEVQKLYGTMPVGHLRKHGGPPEGAHDEFRYRRLHGELKRSYLFVGFRTPGEGHRDNAALEVLSTILGAGRASRLSVRLREELVAATAVSASNWQYEDVGMFEIRAICDPINLDMTTRELFVEIERLRRWGPTPDELERARQILLTGQAFDFEEVLGQASTLAAYESTGSYSDYDREFRDLLDVSIDDVQRVLDKYIQIDRASVLEYVPWGQPTGVPAKEMRDHIDAILVAAARDMHAPTFAERSEGLAPIAQREEWRQRLEASGVHSPQIQSYELSRGGSLVVQQNPTSPTTTVSVWFRGGRIAEQPKYSGITQVLQRVMIKETANRRVDQLAQEIEAMGSGLGRSVGDDWMGFRIAGLARDLPDQLDILFDVVTQPTLSDEQFTNELRLQKPVTEGVEDQSAAWAMDLMRGLLYGEHGYGRPAQGTITGLMGLTRERIEEDYFDRIRPETMVVAVSGDVDADLVAEMVRNYEAGWTYTQLPVPSDAAGFFTADQFGEPTASPANPMRVVRRLRSQSAMAMAWPTVPLTHPDRAAFAVLSEITGGLGGTFFEEIRSRRGLAYQVSTFNNNRMMAGEFAVFVACTPDSVDVVRNLATRLTRSLATDPPTQEQLDRAKSALIGMWKIGGQTNAARARRLALLELSGRPLSELEEWPQRIAAVTVDDLQRIARQWLDRDPVATGLVDGKAGDTPVAPDPGR